MSWEESSSQGPKSTTIYPIARFKMVNFNDPGIIAKETSACAPQPFSRSQRITEHIFQGKSTGSGILWMASSCGPSFHWHSIAPISHIAQFLTPSWEFVITLEYEWNVIRGRRPYRWPILVCNHSSFSVCSATFSAKLIACVIVALLSYPCGHPRGCGSKYI